MVDTHDNGLGVVLDGSIVDATLHDVLGHLSGEETTSELTNIVRSKGTPLGFLEVTSSGGVHVVLVVEGV